LSNDEIGRKGHFARLPLARGTVMDELVWDDTEKLEAYLKEIVSTLSQTPDGAGGVRYRYRNVWNIDTLREVREEITKSFSELGYEVRSVPFQPPLDIVANRYRSSVLPISWLRFQVPRCRKKSSLSAPITIPGRP
jgi:2'-5' RNA ligase